MGNYLKSGKLYQGNKSIGSDPKNTLIPLKINEDIFTGEMFFVDDGDGVGKLIGALYPKTGVNLSNQVVLFSMPDNYKVTSVSVPKIDGTSINENTIFVTNCLYQSYSYEGQICRIYYEDNNIISKKIDSVLYAKNTSALVTGVTDSGHSTQSAYNYYSKVLYTKSL